MIEYRDKRQIMLDVNRAFVHFPKGKQYILFLI